MLVKYIAIILLCISNVLLVGHNVVPHHHEHDHDHHSVADHHDAHHHHNHKQSHNHHSEKDSGLADLFGFMNHTSDYVRNDQDAPVFERTQWIKDHVIVAVSHFQLEDDSKCPSDRIKPPIYRDPDYYPPPNSHKGLRAPPVFFS